ncbi:MAG: hypothetical protein JOY80_10940 [Candidatus Dormibacteraeota bacterium]|nr:hypothetical protein [Candidatus Dormibacteraeota bacterium]
MGGPVTLPGRPPRPPVPPNTTAYVVIDDRTGEVIFGGHPAPAVLTGA